MDHQPIAATLIAIAFGTWLTVAGCGRADDREFHSYSELERSGRPAAAETNASEAARGSAGVGRISQPVTSRASVTNSRSADEIAVRAAAAPAGNESNDGPVEAPRPGGDADEQPTAEIALDHGASREQVTSIDSGSLPPRLAVTASAAADPPVEAPRPEPREIKLLVPHRSFRVEGPEGAIRVSYDDVDLLKVLNMEPVPPDCVAYFPDWLRELDGKRIRIRGFMYPPFETTGIRGFVLARDNQICCFGRDPKRYDVIDVFLRKGVTTDYIQNRPFDVVGVFHIQPEADDGELYQLYVIDDAIVVDR